MLERITLNELAERFEITDWSSIAKHGDKIVNFWGFGFYSLNDRGEFEKGKAPTFTRIQVRGVYLADKILENRWRCAVQAKARRLIVRINCKMFDYSDAGKREKAEYVLERLRAIAHITHGRINPVTMRAEAA